MQYVYLLSSSNDGRLYVGCTENLKTRLELHNKGVVKSTKGYRLWRLVYYEAYTAKLDATKREKQLKMHAAKSELVGRLKLSLKS